MFTCLKYERIQIIIAYCYSKQLFKNNYRHENHREHFLKLEYTNKGFDFINIADIVNDYTVKEIIPAYCDDTELHSICHICKMPTRKYVFNYSDLCKNVKIEGNIEIAVICL